MNVICLYVPRCSYAHMIAISWALQEKKTKKKEREPHTPKRDISGTVRKRADAAATFARLSEGFSHLPSSLFPARFARMILVHDLSNLSNRILREAPKAVGV